MIGNGFSVLKESHGGHHENRKDNWTLLGPIRVSESSLALAIKKLFLFDFLLWVEVWISGKGEKADSRPVDPYRAGEGLPFLTKKSECDFFCFLKGARSGPFFGKKWTELHIYIYIYILFRREKFIF